MSDSLPYYKNATILFEGARCYSKANYETSVFLSHSHKDADYVKDVVAFLRNRGVNCYVDWMDDNMPEKTSGMTAIKLKQKIAENDKFVFLATNNAIDSKWCNWEVGYGDCKKYIDRIAIFPLRDDYVEWKGNEYLQIYPCIEKSDFTKDYFNVKYPDGSICSLREWLKR